MDTKKRNTVGMRADKGWTPLIVLAIVGFILGAGIVFVVAVHDMWVGGTFRHYPTSLYVMAGLFGAVATLVLGVIFCWCADVIEEEFLDEPAEEKVAVTVIDRDENGAIEKVVTTEKKQPEKE